MNPQDRPRVGHCANCGRDVPCPVELSVIDSYGRWGLSYFCGLDCLSCWIERTRPERDDS